MCHMVCGGTSLLFMPRRRVWIFSLMSVEIYSNKQTNRDSKRYRGKAEGRQCRIAMSCALSIWRGYKDTTRRVTTLWGVLSLSQGEHEDTVEDRENRQHKCGSRRYYVRMVNATDGGGISLRRGGEYESIVSSCTNYDCYVSQPTNKRPNKCEWDETS